MLGLITPRSTGPERPSRCLNDDAPIHRRPTRRLGRREQRSDHSPHLIRDHITRRHASKPRGPATGNRLATRPSMSDRSDGLAHLTVRLSRMPHKVSEWSAACRASLRRITPWRSERSSTIRCLFREKFAREPFPDLRVPLGSCTTERIENTEPSDPEHQEAPQPTSVTGASTAGLLGVRMQVNLGADEGSYSLSSSRGSTSSTAASLSRDRRLRFFSPRSSAPA